MPKKDRKPSGKKGSPASGGKRPKVTLTARSRNTSPPRAYRELLKKVLDVVPVPVFVTFDREAQYATANLAGLESLGMAAGQNVSKTAPPTESTPPYQVIENGLEADPRQLPLQVAAREAIAVTDVPLEVHYADGTVRQYLANAAPILDKEGEWRAAVGVFVDTTSRHRSEEVARAAAVAKVVQASEERLRAAMEASFDGFWDRDLVTGRVFHSARMNEMVGLPPVDRIVDTDTWRARVHPDDLIWLASDYEAVLEGLRERVDVTYRVRCEDGAWKWVRSRAKVVERARDGHPARIAGVVSDVDAVKRAEEALQAGEQRTRALVSNGPDVVIVMDERANVTFASANIEAAFGRPVAEALGGAAMDFVHPDDLPNLLEALSEVVSVPGGVGRAEGRILHRDGSWRVVEATGRNLLHDPAVRGVVLNVRDVTENRRLETQLREAQKMESVGRLAGGIAHDFNNLLTVIMAGVGELGDAAASGLPTSKELVDDLSNASERARDLTRQLLLFARKQVASPIPVNLNDIVADNVKLLRRTLGEDVKVVVALQDGLSLTHCDPGHASQVLMNLAVNARDAMPGGGVLTIETRNADISTTDTVRDPALQPGNWVQLLVRDTGHGISSEVRARLFEPFFTTKARGQGTGLGLATVHGIVSQLKGFIVVRSEEGRGAAFEVYLPRADRAVAPAGTVQEPGAPRGTETILVVDDEEAVRGAVARALRNAGYEALTVGDGVQALDLGPRLLDRVHLVLTDVVMPGLSGRDVVEGLRRLRPALPALYMSGFTDKTIIGPDHLNRQTQFISKPFTPEELLTKVRAMLAAQATDGRHGDSPGMTS